jgi:hypothetical protein
VEYKVRMISNVEFLPLNRFLAWHIPSQLKQPEKNTPIPFLLPITLFLYIEAYRLITYYRVGGLPGLKQTCSLFNCLFSFPSNFSCSDFL